MQAELSLAGWAAVAAGALSVAALLLRWWWSTRAKRALEDRRRENEEISRRADAGDAGWFNDRLDDWMRQGG